MLGWGDIQGLVQKMGHVWDHKQQAEMVERIQQGKVRREINEKRFFVCLFFLYFFNLFFFFFLLNSQTFDDSEF